MGPIALLYVWSFPYFENLNNPNELVRVYMTLSMVDDGSYDIEPVCKRFGWLNDRSVVQGRAYSSKAPGASFAGVPVYAAVKLASRAVGASLERRDIVRILRLAVCVLPALLLLVWFRGFLDTLGWSAFAREAVFLGYALGSPAFIYVHQFAGHVPAAVSLMSAWLLLARARANGGRWEHWRACAFGFALACAPVFEYQCVAPGAVVGAALLAERGARRPATLALVAAGAAIPIGLMMHFHWVAFGSPLRTGYAFIENPAFQLMLQEGWMGLTYPRFDRLGFLLFSMDTGLMFWSPYLAACLVACVLVPVALWVRSGFGSKRIHAIGWSFATCVALLLFICANTLWRAGWTAGPRYLTALAPMASVVALAGIGEAERLWGGPVRILTLTAVLLSIFFSGVSGVIYPHFPVTFSSPVFEVLIPMLRDGFTPHNLGRDLIGLEGGWGYLPVVVVGVVPLMARLVWLSSGQWWRRAAALATAIGLALLLCQPFMERARRSPMPQWGLEDLQGVYTSWEPLEGVALFERAGCSEARDLWSMKCGDAIEDGRVKMRMGLRWLAAIRYRASLKTGRQ